MYDLIRFYGNSYARRNNVRIETRMVKISCFVVLLIQEYPYLITIVSKVIRIVCTDYPCVYACMPIYEGLYMHTTQLSIHSLCVRECAHK